MTRRHLLNRRAILRGFGGLAIGLPLLESLNRSAFAQGMPGGPKRFIVFFEHGGTLCNTSVEGWKFDGTGSEQGHDAWKPADPGEALVLGPIHQPLIDHVGSLMVLRGIDNMAARIQSDWGGDHGWSNVTALTAARASRPTENDFQAHGPSIDTVIADRLAARGETTAFKQILLEISAHNYGTPFMRGTGQAVDGESDPLAAFDSLFAGVTDSETGPDPVAVRARALQKSILDGTSEGVALLKPKLSAQDRLTVQAHLDHLRTLEARLEKASLPPAPGCRRPTLGEEFRSQETIGPAQVDNVLAALRCGLTQVAGINLGDLETGWLNPPYPAGYGIGHSLHHASRDVGPEGVEASSFNAWYKSMLDNHVWRMTLVARLLDGLAATPEGDGTMLDNTLVLVTSEFSQGAVHSAADLPILLAGKAGGKLRTGRHLNYNLKAVADPNTRSYETRASTHNLFTSILNLFGEPDTHFGSTGHAYVEGPLSGLT